MPLLYATPAAMTITTDCARVAPGQVVEIQVRGGDAQAALSLDAMRWDGRVIRIRADGTGTEARVRWKAPAPDGTGYLLIARRGTSLATCGLDVSSRWTLYPRYGYLAHFGPELETRAPGIIDGLRDLGLNVLQFYDFQFRHDQPLSDQPIWPDIANRPTCASTVQALVKACKRNRIAAMAYNLGYGGYADYAEHGMSPAWGLYSDPLGKRQITASLPSGWATPSIALFAPDDPGLIDHLAREQQRVMDRFSFDGWHIDTLGDPGAAYRSGGTAVKLDETFPAFLRGVRQRVSGDLVMNAVAGYGLAAIASGPTAMTYMECWDKDAQRTYLDLNHLVRSLRSTGRQGTVAGYMNYRKAQRGEGEFNTSGVLLTQATLLASGGFQIALGDDGRMLCHEYFPNRNLAVPPRLLAVVRDQIHFAIAYQNLLRGPDTESIDLPVRLGGGAFSRDAEPGTVWAFATRTGQFATVHCINLVSATSNEWRDTDGLQPPIRPQAHLHATVPQRCHRVWWASPDTSQGIRMELPVRDGEVQLPELNVWGMLILELK